MAGSAEESIPRLNGRYLFERTLAEGTMGRVCRATARGQDEAPQRGAGWAQSLGEAFAIKLAHPHCEGDPQVRRRFMAEAQGLASLRHPHIVPLLDYGLDEEGRFCLVMPLLRDAQSLDVAWRAWDFPTFAQAFSQLLEAVAYVHERGHVHRDLKPQNVLCTGALGAHKLWVVDFGMACFQPPSAGAWGDASPPKAREGTPHYMAPERMHEDYRPTPAEDVYALGIILWQFLTGSLPFDGQHALAVALAHEDQPLPQLKIRPNLSAIPLQIAQLLCSCLEKRPQARIPNARQLLQAFTALLQSGAAPQRRQTLPAQADLLWQASAAPPSVPTTGPQVVPISGPRARGDGLPEGLSPSSWRALLTHYQDEDFARAVVAFYAESGQLALRISEPIDVTRLPQDRVALVHEQIHCYFRSDLVEVALSILRVAALCPGLLSKAELGRVCTELELCEGEVFSAQLSQLQMLGMIKRHLGRVRCADASLEALLVARLCAQAEGRLWVVRVAQALEATLPQVEPKVLADLYTQAQQWRPGGLALERMALRAFEREAASEGLALLEEAARFAQRGEGTQSQQLWGRLQCTLAQRHMQSDEAEHNERAREAGLQALQAARQLGDDQLCADALRVLAAVRQREGAWDEACVHLSELRASYERLGDILRAAEASLALGYFLQSLQRRAEAAVGFEQAMHGAEQARHMALYVEATVARAHLALREGQAQRAIDCLAEACAGGFLDRVTLGWAHWMRAEAHLLKGQLDLAQRDFMKLAQLAQQARQSELMAWAEDGAQRMRRLRKAR